MSSRDFSAHLAQILEDLPDKPGVYLMKDADGRVIYVGKASSLKSRVRSYFQNSSGLDAKTVALVEKIVDLETVLVDSARDALILESNLIKEYRPHYNVRLRDDKHYPYLKLTMREEFPRLVVARRAKNDGSRYFGPYINSGAMRQAQRLIQAIFPLRSCKTMHKGQRACLNSHIGRCLAPCEGRISAAKYAEIVEQVILFLQGKTKEIVRERKLAMQEASRKMDFEEAARCRDQLLALEEVQRQQILDQSARGKNFDLVAVEEQDGQAAVQVFFMRKGKIIGREHFFMINADLADEALLMSRFLQEYYGEGESSMPLLYLNHLPRDADLLQQVFSEKSGRKVTFIKPQRGDKLNLLRLVAKNARLVLKQYLEGKDRQSKKNAVALEDLRQALQLSETPWRLECYDISHLSGTNKTGSMVVFTGGAPEPKLYRRFRIKTVDGNNDFASLQEVLERRLQRGLNERAEHRESADFGVFPDLLIVDGGKGQLSAVCETLSDLGLSKIKVIALAEKEEEIYFPGQAKPLKIDQGRPALQLLQRIRDEAHRFALNYHRNLRAKSQINSELLQIAGVGPKRSQILLQTFGSLEQVKKASLDQLLHTPGLNKKTAYTVWRHWHKDDIINEE